jgi:hypothetical protein
VKVVDAVLYMVSSGSFPVPLKMSGAMLVWLDQEKVYMHVHVHVHVHVRVHVYMCMSE